MERVMSSIYMASATLVLLYTGQKVALLALICSLASTEVYNITTKCNYSIEESILACACVLGPFVAASMNMNVEHIIQVLCIVWASDSGALIMGSILGGPKFGSISPKKTYSGLLGGLVSGYCAARAVSYRDSSENILIVCMATQLGDILESAAKRLAGLKDSNVYFYIPGHGGLLDRIDGLLLALPIACLIYQR
jgi:phosphatidate cytidylyltransferase